MLLALVVNYLQLEKLKNQLERQNIKISELKKTKDSMSGKLDGIKNSDEIASLARYKLGMVYPEDKQVVFINVEPQEAETDVKDNVFLSPVISILKIFGTNDKEGTSWNHPAREDKNTLLEEAKRRLEMASAREECFSYFF